MPRTYYQGGLFVCFFNIKHLFTCGFIFSVKMPLWQPASRVSPNVSASPCSQSPSRFSPGFVPSDSPGEGAAKALGRPRFSRSVGGRLWVTHSGGSQSLLSLVSRSPVVVRLRSSSSHSGRSRPGSAVRGAGVSPRRRLWREVGGPPLRGSAVPAVPALQVGSTPCWRGERAACCRRR